MPVQMTTLPPCPIPPSVRNAQPPVVFSDARTAQYTCAYGFQMAGDNRIYCFGAPNLRWHGRPPTCTRIEQPVWGYALIAALLGLLSILVLVLLLAYCLRCCPNSISPESGGTSGRWCRSCKSRQRESFDADDEDLDQRRAYVIPVNGHYTNKERHVQRTVRHIVINDPRKGQQNVMTNGVYASNTYLVPVDDSSVKDKRIWQPHARVVRNDDVRP